MTPAPTHAARLNELFGLGRAENGVAGEVVVDADGWIQFGSRSLTQAEAVDIAEAMLTAVQASISREQIDAPDFRTSTTQHPCGVPSRDAHGWALVTLMDSVQQRTSWLLRHSAWQGRPPSAAILGRRGTRLGRAIVAVRAIYGGMLL